MELNAQELRKFSLWFVILALGVLVFILIRPVVVSIIGGLVLAYVFNPAYKKLLAKTNRKNLSAFLISLLIILMILIPLWFLVPLMLQQVFNLFTLTQNINIAEIVSTLFPTASVQFSTQMTVALTSFIGKIVSLALEYLNSLFLDIPIVSLHLVIVFFVFFYGLRDYDKLTNFISDLSPFSKAKEKEIVTQFENITDSVVYGQIIVGIVQGALAGLGFLIFGVKNVIVLTVLAMLISILPILGPFLIWIPIALYFFISGQTGIGIGYLIYNLAIVSTVDNILRTYLLSRKSNLSPAVALIAMIGGFLIFGVIGFLLGPLVVAYFIMFLQSYREKRINRR